MMNAWELRGLFSHAVNKGQASACMSIWSWAHPWLPPWLVCIRPDNSIPYNCSGNAPYVVMCCHSNLPHLCLQNFHLVTESPSPLDLIKFSHALFLFVWVWMIYCYYKLWHHWGKFCHLSMYMWNWFRDIVFVTVEVTFLWRFDFGWWKVCSMNLIPINVSLDIIINFCKIVRFGI